MLEESMWSVVLLIGTEHLGQMASYMLTFIFFLNVSFQSFFVFLLGTTDLTQPEYHSDDVTDYRLWRRNEGAFYPIELGTSA